MVLNSVGEFMDRFIQTSINLRAIPIKGGTVDCVFMSFSALQSIRKVGSQKHNGLNYLLEHILKNGAPIFLIVRENHLYQTLRAAATSELEHLVIPITSNVSFVHGQAINVLFGGGRGDIWYLQSGYSGEEILQMWSY